MKRTIVAVLGAAALAGCVAVPYEPAPAYYSAPAPTYYYYPAPGPAVSFHYSHRPHYRRHWQHW